MTFLVTVIAVLSVIAVVLAELAVRLTKHRRSAQVVMGAVIAFAGVAPILMHMDRTTRYALNSGLGRFPQFERLTLLLVCATWIACVLLLIVRMRLLTIPLPFIAGWIYLRRIMQFARSDDFVMYDNVPNVWMFILILAATLAAFLYHVRLAFASSD
jgi:hypothetical protein